MDGDIARKLDDHRGESVNRMTPEDLRNTMIACKEANKEVQSQAQAEPGNLFDYASEGIPQEDWDEWVKAKIYNDPDSRFYIAKDNLSGNKGYASFDDLVDPEENFDPIHPEYYTKDGIEVIDIIEAFDLGFHEGNALKYLLRHKPGNPREQELKKALYYLHRKIDYDRKRQGKE